MLIRLILAGFLVLSPMLFDFAAAGEPAGQLKESVDRIITLLNAPRLKAPEMKLIRRNEVFRVVEERFDFTEMSRLSVGSFWYEMSDAQQKEFEVAFASLLESTYITKIEKYTDEKVVYGPERSRGESNFSIHTEIVSDGNNVIPVDYLLHKVENQWLVYDVSIEGLSLVSNYRSQFNEAIRHGGFSHLMRIIEEKQRKVNGE